MNWKHIVFICVLIKGLYDLALLFIQYRSLRSPVPQNVSDVYDKDAYISWKQYMKENICIGAFYIIISNGIFLHLLSGKIYNSFSQQFPWENNQRDLAVIFLYVCQDLLIRIVVNWIRTFVIEKRYGLNRSNSKIFWIDTIRNLILRLFIYTVLMYFFACTYSQQLEKITVYFFCGYFSGLLLNNYGRPIFERFGKKFTPLEDGPLKDKLMQMLASHGYRVKAIQVMAASRRTARVNAYFIGFGRSRSIVLYDNLFKSFSEDEICAIFAHELGHGLHKDVPKKILLNMCTFPILIGIFHICTIPWLYIHFGFFYMNLGFSVLLIMIFYAMVHPFICAVMNIFSRRYEYKADKQAVLEGYADPLITGLKKMYRTNYNDLTPAPVLVVLQGSHPPLTHRIDAIEKAKRELKGEKL